MMRRGRGGPGLVRAAAGTAVIAGTAGAVHHRQQQRWDNKAAAQQAEYQQAEAQAQMQADMQQMQAQMAAQQAQLAAAQQAAQQAQMAAQQPQMAPPQPMPAAAPASGSTDRIAQLQQLAGLKQAGVLTEAEFEAEKAKILAGG